GGNILHREGNLADSEALRIKALGIRQRLAPGSLALAKSWGNLAMHAFKIGNLERAEKLFRNALTIQEQVAPQTLDRARSLRNLGNIHYRRSQFNDAQRLYSLSLDISQKIAPGSLDVADCLDNLGTLAYTRDDFDTAEIHFRSALAIRQHFSPAGLAIAGNLLDLGNLALMRGDLLSAESFYRRSLSIHEKEAPGTDGHARALENMGMVAHRRGDMISAQSFFLESLKIRQSYAPHSLLVAHNLNNLGVVADRLGELAKSEEFHRQALSIREISAPGSLDLADTLANLGVLMRQKGRTTEAEELFKKAITINQQHGSDLSTATCLLNLGIIYLQLHRAEEAEKMFQENFSIHNRLTPGTARETDALYRLGKAKRALGKTKEAEMLYERAFALAEEQLANLGGSQETRASFTLLNLDLYRDYLDVLIHSGQLERAFLLSERYRGGIMLRLIAERDIFINDTLPQETSERKQEIDAEHDRLLEKLDHGHLPITLLQTEEALRKLRRLREERAFLYEEARRLSPKLSTLKYFKPLNFSAAQKALDPKTLLLSYSVGKDCTYLILLRNTGRSLEIISLLVTDDDLRNEFVALRTLVSNTQTESSLRLPRRKQLQTISEHLFDVLIGPAIEHIENSDRILIIPDGILHLLPWSTLMAKPSYVTYTDGLKYFAEWKPIHIALSVTLFAELSRTRREKDFVTYTRPELAVFGDPHIPEPLVNNPEDLRETHNESDPKDRSLYLERLPATRIEAQTIASLFSGARLFLGKEATEEHARTLPHGTRIVHFATHGILDQQFPLNSSMVLSAQELQENGEVNGLLQAWEIFEHIHLDADLVVLSACETGLGKEMGGEGLIGLTRAFHYAGARSVMASLWKISDRTTAELMVRFYRHLKEGKPKDEALRAAQMELIRGPIQVTNEKGEVEEIDASAPYYWAAFQIYGDWQ
ncbi:MAG TPA: tetratricopeptide repeat protein, partial [Thermoanaerobaculia bacterium]|nr:tetratricopeptide repeat protein [Thermoanaerobaculia bacterium]